MRYKVGYIGNDNYDYACFTSTRILTQEEFKKELLKALQVVGLEIRERNGNLHLSVVDIFMCGFDRLEEELGKLGFTSEEADITCIFNEDEGIGFGQKEKENEDISE